MFKKLGISAAVLVGLSLLTPTAAVAQRYYRHWHGGPYYHGGIYFGPYAGPPGPYYGPYADGYYNQWGLWTPYFGVTFR
jgi:hypothetical protein